MFVVTSKKKNKIEVVEDFLNLPKKYKNQILQYFNDNENRRTVYLVDKKYKGKYNKEKEGKK